MEKLPMCRICLVENVCMFVVVNRNLHELYEKLTDIPFVTEDSRPILTCFFCCAKLKQCYRLLRQCLEAEELFAQMMNEDYEHNPVLNQDHLEFGGGFIQSPIVHISIDDECQTESIAIKEELPAVCAGLDDIIEPKVDHHQSDELELENNIIPHHSESDLEDYVPLIKIKNEVEEEQEVSKNTQRARETTRTNVAKKPTVEKRRRKLEDEITKEQTRKDESDSKVIRTTRKRTSKRGSYFKEPYKCDICDRSFSVKYTLTNHIRTHTGEKPYKCDACQRSFCEKSALTKHSRIHTGEKPFKCAVCQYSFSHKVNLTTHIRIHTGERPFKCDICARSFSEKNTLKNHILIHAGEKPFKCEICSRSFRKSFHLKKHIHIHTGEKPYMCHVCQRSFTEKSTLTRHIRIHTGD